MISTNSSIRTGLCEEVSSQPDFIRDLADMGFNLENCEVWFERAVIGVMTIAAMVIMVRVSRTIPAICVPRLLPHPLRISACRSMPLSYDLGIFRDLHLPLLLPPLLPLPIVVNINLVCGITARELGLTAPDLPATYAIHLVIIALAKRDARSVRLFSSSAQQPVRGASERDAGRRGMGISHRTLLTVVPSTDSQTQPLWEDKPPDPSRRWIAPEVREGSLVIVSCFCVWFCIMFYWSRTHCVSLHISIVLALGRQRPFERISIVALSPICTSLLVCVIWSPYRAGVRSWAGTSGMTVPLFICQSCQPSETS